MLFHDVMKYIGHENKKNILVMEKKYYLKENRKSEIAPKCLQKCINTLVF